MAETVRYINSTEAGGGTTVLSASPGRYLRGDGLDAWHVTPVFDPLVGDEDTFAGYALNWTEWTLRFAIGATSYNNARGTLAAWRKVFMEDVSREQQGTVAVVHNSGTYTIDCAPMTPDIDGPEGAYVGVRFKFRSKSPFWIYGDAQSTTSAFNGTANVDVLWDNTGDYKTWPTHVITGVVGTARITDIDSSDYLEIGTATANADDQIWIWTDSPLIRYYEHGTSAGDPDKGTNWTGYGGTVSTFYALQAEAGTARLSAATGTATYELRYDIRKAGIG